MRGQKLARHPDIDLVISLVKQGHGARSIASIINEKHKASPRYQITFITVNDFINNFLKLNKEDRQKIRDGLKTFDLPTIPGRMLDKDLNAKAIVQSKLAVAEIHESIAKRELDVMEELETLYDKAMSEMDDINNRVNKMNSDRDFVMGKSALISAIEAVRKVLADIKMEQADIKVLKDNNTQSGNVVIQFGHVSAYVEAMKQSIIETFREAGLVSQLPAFLDKLSNKFNKLNTVQVVDGNGQSVQITRNTNG